MDLNIYNGSSVLDKDVAFDIIWAVRFSNGNRIC